MSNKLLQIALILLVIFATLSVAELLIRKFNPQLTYSAVSSSHDCYDADPLVPFTTAKNHTCKVGTSDGDPNVTASLNNLGYRGKDFSPAQPANKLRILVIGDSMTFGWGLADDMSILKMRVLILNPISSFLVFLSVIPSNSDPGSL